MYGVICVSLCLMRHYALTFLALKRVITEFDASLRKAFLLRDFHVLHSSAATLSNIPGLDCLMLVIQFYILTWDLSGSNISVQLWLIAKCHTNKAV